jgi:hypothetical protein
VYDRVPFVPHRVADAAVSWHISRRDRRAAKDPVWSAIEAKRRQEGRPGILLLSEADGLGWAEWNEQQQIEDRLTPDPFWLPAARWLRGRPVRTARSRRASARIRGRRGWAPVDTYSLDVYLCALLADTLDHLAKHAHGFPADRESFEVWSGELTAAAAALRGWADHGEDNEVSDELSAALDAEDGSEAAKARSAAALEASRAAETHRLEEAQVAMRWVADNLAALWD